MLIGWLLFMGYNLKNALIPDEIIIKSKELYSKNMIQCNHRLRSANCIHTTGKLWIEFMATCWLLRELIKKEDRKWLTFFKESSCSDLKGGRFLLKLLLHHSTLYGLVFSSISPLNTVSISYWVYVTWST